LRPAPAASRRVLIRRLSFDLCGSVPSPEGVEEFVQDESPDAYGRLIERLLASPRYGERWGRHWLDVVRYADSNGLDENIAHGNAWRYRDWVVSAFNADLSFDRFVAAQLAGDLLEARSEAERLGNIVATGYLSLGPKVLAEGDELKLEMDIVDEQVDTIGRSLVGISFGCARCHDHKFDPFSTENYYAIAGIFKSTKTMESLKRIARWNENSVATRADRERHAAEQKKLTELKKAHQSAKAISDKSPKPETKAATKAAKAALDQFTARLLKLPTAMGVSKGTPSDLRVNVRGDPLNLGASVPRGVPALFSLAASPAPKSESGRQQLADWVTRPENPLTNRVIVNRVWRWHFSRGLVDTPDNFGRLGSKPSHPELLDWLALRFLAGGQSIKALHRILCLSSTYRMSAKVDERALEIDPENRLLWRWSPRRLEAEAIRDAVLEISGELDLQIGGQALTHVANRAFLFDHTSKDLTSYESRRRSLYLPVVRNHLYDFFQLFDYPDPSVGNGHRATTTVATQALFVLNSEFFDRAAAGFAGRLRSLDRKPRLERMFLEAYSRPPSSSELVRAEESLAQLESAWRKDGHEDAESRAWKSIAQMILASSEFVYVR
ncbi:MAG: DUF1549 and DUF1553 domain-containing protein, partial [Planctomycetota bacterium]